MLTWSLFVRQYWMVELMDCFIPLTEVEKLQMSSANWVEGIGRSWSFGGSHPVLNMKMRPTRSADLGHRARCILDVPTTKQVKQDTSQLNVSYINARSVKNKTLSIADHIIQHDVDVFSVTET